MNNFQKDIDDRTNLTLSNRSELPLLRLGKSVEEQKSELSSINVLKLHEIVSMPIFTRLAGMKTLLLGMVNIRDQVIPVIDLPVVVGYKPETGLNILLITEYARSVQAFAVGSVESIIRLDWRQVYTVEKAINGHYITSIACLDGDREANNLALVLDVEQILYDIVPVNHGLHTTDLKINKFNTMLGVMMIVVDDSKVARAMLEKSPNATEAPYLMHVTGQGVWEKTQRLSAEAQTEGKPVSEKTAPVLTDLEMPEMDGPAFTRKIKTDERLKKIPVVTHSSLSGSTNEDHVRRAKADGYAAKFEVNELSSVIREAMDRTAKGISGPLMSRQLLN